MDNLLEKVKNQYNNDLNEVKIDLEYYKNKCKIQEQQIIELKDKFEPSAYEITRLRRLVKNKNY